MDRFTHRPQNGQTLVSMSRSRPQELHFLPGSPSAATGASPSSLPQSPQNFFPSGFSEPQSLHFIAVSVLRIALGGLRASLDCPESSPATRRGRGPAHAKSSRHGPMDRIPVTRLPHWCATARTRTRVTGRIQFRDFRSELNPSFLSFSVIPPRHQVEDISPSASQVLVDSAHCLCRVIILQPTAQLGTTTALRVTVSQRVMRVLCHSEGMSSSPLAGSLHTRCRTIQVQRGLDFPVPP